MGIIANLLQDVALPKMVRVRQIFPDVALEDVESAIRAEFQNPAISER